MLGPSVLEDINVQGLADAFRTQTDAGRVALVQRLSNPTADALVIGNRQRELQNIKTIVRSDRPTVMNLLSQLHTTESDVRSIVSAGSDERHAEWYAQILWSPTGRWAWLNTAGWLTELVVLFRTILMPGLAAMIPVFVLAAPLVFTILQGRSISVSEYIKILSDAIKRALPPVMGKPRFAGRGGPLEVGEQFLNIAMSVGVFVASLWSQVSSAIKMRVVVADMRKRAASLRTYAKSVGILASTLGVRLDSSVRLVWDDMDLGAFGQGWNMTDSLEKLLEAGGHLDMLVAVARRGFTCLPAVGDAISVTDLWHPGLEAKRVYNSLQMGSGGGAAEKTKSNHVILTGPNRGGKSTLLKSLGAAVLMHQTLGIVFARRASLPVFGAIQTALRPADTLGSMSLFEAEIDFARGIRDLQHDGPLFLMMDEIFHGTNAHEGTEAATVFLDWLYAQSVSRVFSVISTHYLDLPRRYVDTQRLCMEAYPTNDGLRYTYKLKEGINEYSSVREILKERGLLRDA